MSDEREWLDFDEIKKKADVKAVLKAYDLFDDLKKRGDELVGRCPLGEKHHGNKTSFAINVYSKAFQCFACKKRGSVLDFVKHYRGLTLREAAQAVLEIMEKENKRVGQAVRKAVTAAKEPGHTRLIDEIKGSDVTTVSDTETDAAFDEAEPDASTLLQSVMTLREAVDRVKAGTLDVNNVVAVDVSTLRYIHAVTKNHAR